MVDRQPAPAPGRGSSSARPRGRRARGEDTRAAIVEAARAEFLERGYRAASLRAVARRAEVDPALVRYWFAGGKPELFVASVVDGAINPGRVAATVAAGPVESMGVRLVTALLAAFEVPQVRDRLLVVFGGMASGAELPDSVREYLMAEVFSRIRPRLAGPDADLRVNLVMSHVVGLILARYVLRLEPLASADPARVVALMGPVIQGYMTPPAPGPLPHGVADE